jgi:hypothetical protein
MRRAGAVVACLIASLATATAVRSEVVQKKNVRASFAASIDPRVLPRTKPAPVSVSLAGRISTTDGSSPPQLRQISIAINRQGQLDYDSLPTCGLRDIQPSTTSGALAACGSALVGEGDFSANVELPQQAPFPSQGRVLAFNGVEDGRPVLFAHVYGTKPVPTSYTLVFSIRRTAGTFGTLLTASLPRVTADWGFVTGITLELGRARSARRGTLGYLNARCPAPPGFNAAVFPLARATFSFASESLGSVLSRVCRVRPH